MSHGVWEMMTGATDVVRIRAWTEEDYWRTVRQAHFYNNMRECDLGLGEVEFYFGMRMVSMKGRLLRVNSRGPSLNCVDRNDFRELFGQSTGFRLIKCNSLGLSLRNVPMSSICDIYALFFGSTWKGRTGVFTNMVQLSHWSRGYRTCTGWVVLLQRRARAAMRERRARRCLALASALHPRLGAGCGIACLGPDMTRLVCEWL